MRKLFAIFVIFFFCSCSRPGTTATTNLSTAVTPQDIRTHIRFLDADSLGGRKAGTAGAAIAARYISDHFKAFGLQPMGDDSTYYQEFITTMHGEDESAQGGKYLSRNVLAKIKGADHPNTYIIMGAPYNYYGQPGNASGASGLMELAQYFSIHQPKKSMLFIAFSGEDMKQFGTQYFVDHPLLPLRKIQAIINIHDIGGLTQDGLVISGIATSKGWNALIHQANTDSLGIKFIPGGVEQTDFYTKEIPLLNYTAHASSGKVDAEGEVSILKHLKQLVTELDTLQTGSLSFDK